MNPADKEHIPIEAVYRSKRRTIALIITPDAKLVIRAPLRVSHASIEDFVAKKRSWILRKMGEMSKIPRTPERKYIDGETFLFLGTSYPLKIMHNRKRGVSLGECLEVNTTLSPYDGEVRECLAAWYRSRAQDVICMRCKEIATNMGCVPSSVKISHAERRWGSCSAKGDIRFSWRLVMAPPEIIDYVIVHELVHIVHHNHSKRFWDAVAAFMPDFQARRTWLRKNDQILSI